MLQIIRRTALTLAAVTVVVLTAAQDRETKTTIVDRFFTEEHEVLANTQIKDGHYTLSYRGSNIEEGYYRNGKRVGEWKFWNLQKDVELKYDYTRKRPTYVLPHTGHTYDQRNYPCIFLGSSLIPFYFITSRAYYPKAEAENKKGGRVVLRLKVNTRGRMTGYTIKSATSENFAEVVRKAADQIPKDEWRWIPSKSKGAVVAGFYDITVVFDNQ